MWLRAIGFAFRFHDATVGGCDLIIVFGVLGGKIHAPFVDTVVAVVVNIDVKRISFSDTGVLQSDRFGLVSGDLISGLRAGGGVLLCIAVAPLFAVNGKDGAALCVDLIIVLGVVSTGDKFDLILLAAVVAVEFCFGEADICFGETSIFEGDLLRFSFRNGGCAAGCVRVLRRAAVLVSEVIACADPDDDC